MGADQALSADERRTAERLLGEAWSSPVSIGAVEVLEERAHALRLVTDDGRTAILKRPKVPYEGQSELEKLGFGIEWATLEYLTAMPEPVAPRLFAGADDPEVLLMEELPPGRSLAESLLGDDAQRAAADLVAYGEALAAMNAWSLGNSADYEAARRRRGVGGDTFAWRASAIAADRDRFIAVVGELGVSTAGVAAELDELETIVAGGEYAGVIHGDPCPDNVRIVDGKCRIFDFEKTGRGSIALDAAYLLAPFPTCWCFARLPSDVASPALVAYEAVLHQAGVDTSDAWPRAVAAALAVSVVGRSEQLQRATQEDERWGTAHMRPRFRVWIDSFLAVADELDVFPRLRTLHTELDDRLRSAWPNTVVPDYPAFASPASPVARL